MKAAVLSGVNKVEIRNVPVPSQAKPGEVIADVEYVGVCKTDQQITTEGLEAECILGHEVVCKVPDTSEHFALNNEISCGQCSYCQEGLTSHCLNLSELGVNQNGGYAEKIRVPQNSLYPFKFDNPTLGVLIEPLSCAIRGVKRILASANLLSVEQPQVSVIGGGMSGALICYLLTHSPNFEGEIVLYDISTASLPWVDKLGIKRVSTPESAVAHIAIECSGSPSGLTTALNVVRNAGIVFIYGVPKPGIHLPVSPHELFMREIAIVTSFAGATEQTMTEAISTIKRDEAFFKQMLGCRISLLQLPGELTSWSPQPGTRTFVDLSI